MLGYRKFVYSEHRRLHARRAETNIDHNISRGRVCCGNKTNIRIDSYPVSIYVFVGERRLDTNVDGDAQGVMGRDVGKLATSPQSTRARIQSFLVAQANR